MVGGVAYTACGCARMSRGVLVCLRMPSRGRDRCTRDDGGAGTQMSC
jgi:hypothetical protein